MDIARLWSEAKKSGAPARSMPAGSSSDDLCPACQRNGRVYCPHKPLLALKAEMAAPLDKQDFFGPSPPNIFVGHFGWPQVNWGPMVGLADGIPDNPKDWYGWGFDEIVRARSMQVRGQAKSPVGTAAFPKSPGMGREAVLPRMLRDSQEAAMSFTPVDLEMHFTRKPSLAVEFHRVNQPMGPSAPLDKLTLADNSRIPSKVDELVQEGVRAQAAMSELARAGFDEHYLTRLLTSGVLGQKSARKLVPTRWGITAVDDTLAKQHMEKIRELKMGDSFLLFFNEYLANRFSVLLLPGAWEYEGFEAWCGTGGKYAISEEYEPHGGRWDYAKKQGGGYYAARLGVSEALATKLKYQYRAIVIREITPAYDLPCGVWVVRQNVRHAFEQEPKKFSSLSEMLEVVQQNLTLPLSHYLSRSKILRQRTLSEF